MRCRKIKRWSDENEKMHNSIVWFGSYGKDSSGHAKFADESHTNFSTDKQAICDSLQQRLSVLRKELWYNVTYGMLLTNKQTTKLAIDSFIVTTIESHPDVRSIISFSSKIDNKKYFCDVRINSIYGELNFNL